jgi:hypothetical protein
MAKSWVSALAFLVVVAVPVASRGQILTLTQSADSTTLGAASSACGPTPGLAYTVANGYFRSYSLSSIPFSMQVVSITFGVQVVTANQVGGFPMTIRLFSDPTPAVVAPYNGLMLRKSESFTLPTITTPTVVTKILSGPPAVFNAGEQLVVEVFASDGTYTTSKFLIGSNSLGQTGPGYIRAPGCANPPFVLTDVTDLASVGFGNMHMIIDVNYVLTTPMTYPGTNEDLTLLSAVGSAPMTTGLANQVKQVTAGQSVTVEVFSPGGGFNFREVALLAQAFPTGSPPFPPVAPNIHMTFPGLTFLIGGVASPFGPELLPPGGVWTSFVVPPGLSGNSVLFQGAIVTFQAPLAANGLYASTDGHEIRIL